MKKTLFAFAVLIVFAAFALGQSIGFVLPWTTPTQATPATVNALCPMQSVNSVCARPFYQYADQTYTAAGVNFVSGSPANPAHFYVGIYSADLTTLLTQATFNAHLNGFQRANWTPQITLPAGNYYYATSADVTNATMKGTTYPDFEPECDAPAFSSPSYPCGVFSSAGVVGGVMPASLGAIFIQFEGPVVETQIQQQ